MLGEIGSIIETTMKFSELMTQRAEKGKALEESRKFLLRNYELEVRSNRLVLDSLNKDNLKKESFIQVLHSIMPSLKNEYGLLILAYLDKFEDVFKTVDEYRLNEDFFDSAREKNIVEAIAFTVLRIDVLKRLSCIPAGSEKFFRKIRLNVRFDNLKKDTERISKSYPLIKQVLDKVVK